MKWLWKRIQEEPAMVAMIIDIAFNQAIAYGFTMSSAQLANWNMLAALVLGFATRQTVVPHSIANSQIKTAIALPSDMKVEDIIAIDKENRNENLIGK